jgi:predicted nucleic acid-binding protein
MRFILDSSVALKWVLPDQDSAKAIRLRDEFHAGLHELLAPDVLPIEVGHALTKAETRQVIATPHGWALWQAVMADCPALAGSISLMPRTYEISSRLRIGAYDCLYVALAEQEQCELLTADSRMANALQQQFAKIVLLSSLP